MKLTVELKDKYTGNAKFEEVANNEKELEAICEKWSNRVYARTTTCIMYGFADNGEYFCRQFH